MLSTAFAFEEQGRIYDLPTIWQKEDKHLLLMEKAKCQNQYNCLCCLGICLVFIAVTAVSVLCAAVESWGMLLFGFIASAGISYLCQLHIFC